MLLAGAQYSQALMTGPLASWRTMPPVMAPFDAPAAATPISAARLTTGPDPNCSVAWTPVAVKWASVSGVPLAALPVWMVTDNGVFATTADEPLTSAILAEPSGHVFRTLVCRPSKVWPAGRSPCLKTCPHVHGQVPVTVGCSVSAVSVGMSGGSQDLAQSRIATPARQNAVGLTGDDGCVSDSRCEDATGVGGAASNHEDCRARGLVDDA